MAGLRGRGWLHVTTPRRAAALARLVGQRNTRLAALIGLPLLAITIFAPFLAPYGPLVQHRGQELLPPGPAFLFGTDEFGRDILSRLMFGGRATLTVGVVAVAVGAAIGSFIGTVAGYLGGVTETVSMRIVDVILSFPSVVIGLAAVAIIGPGVVGVIVAIAVANIPVFARLSRAGALALRHREFVEAAVVSGSSTSTVVRTHIFRNLVPSLLVQLGISGSVAMLLEAGLSYLGLGVQPPDPSWGNMLAGAQTFMRQVPLYAIAPGVALMFAVLSVNLVVDGMRDAVDPTWNRERTVA